MAIDLLKLQSHIQDYSSVFGEQTDRFVCPITMTKCDVNDLIDGHILNAGFHEASRKTVIQYGKIDHYYGQTVEPGFIWFLNYNELSRSERISSSSKITVQFPDGSKAHAFPALRKNLKSARGRFPQKNVMLPDGEIFPLFIKTEFSDSRLHGNASLTLENQPIDRAHWTASLLKAAYLTLFDFLGYAAIKSPLTDTLRNTLAFFFHSQVPKKGVNDHFADFRNAAKILGKGGDTDSPTQYTPFAFDTLRDKKLTFHYTPSGTLFGVSCIFRINQKTHAVMIPETTHLSDVDTAWKYYSWLMTDDMVPQSIHLVEVNDNSWKVYKKALVHRYSHSILWPE